MAYTNNIIASDPLYQNAARTLSFTVYADASTDEQIALGTATCQDIAGYTLRWRMQDRNNQRTVRITKTSATGISITGTFNATPASNTQRAVVTLAAADVTADLDTYDHGLWRTDSGSEVPLCTGTVVVKSVP